MTTIEGYVLLDALPEDDPRRATPLHLVGAEYFHVKQEGEWQPVTPDKFWGFAYNDLYGPWVVFHRWRVPVDATHHATASNRR